MEPNHLTNRHKLDELSTLSTDISAAVPKRFAKRTSKNAVRFRRYIADLARFVRKVDTFLRFIQGHGLEEDVMLQQALDNTIRCLRDHFHSVRSGVYRLSNKFFTRSEGAMLAKDKWRSDLQSMKTQRGAIRERLTTIEGMMVRIATTPMYYAVLVTTPRLHFYCVVTDWSSAPIDEPEPIDWRSTNRNEIPSLGRSLQFRRHFALCLVEKGLWESRTQTLAAKFKDAPFWEISVSGPCSLPGGAWDRERIATINAIQELGTISCDGNIARQICTSYYNELRRGWNYKRMWWNDGDFALCLAYLVGGETARWRCRAIWRLRTQLRTQIVRPRGHRFTNLARKLLGHHRATLLSSAVGLDEESKRNLEKRTEYRMLLGHGRPELAELLTD